MSCLVDGTIPPSSGLSSSSALVCCAGLVTMEANQKSLSKVKVCSRQANKGFYSLHGHPTFSSTLMSLLPVSVNAAWNYTPSVADILMLCSICNPPGGAGWALCQMWALHWHRGRRHGPVHFLPGRERKSMPAQCPGPVRRGQLTLRGRSVLNPPFDARNKTFYCVFLTGKADRVQAPEGHRRQASRRGRVCDLKLLRGDEQSCNFSLQHARGRMPNCCKGWPIPSSWSPRGSSEMALTVWLLVGLRCWPELVVWTPARCWSWPRFRPSWRPPWRRCSLWWMRCCTLRRTAERKYAGPWASPPSSSPRRCWAPTHSTVRGNIENESLLTRICVKILKIFAVWTRFCTGLHRCFFQWHISNCTNEPNTCTAKLRGCCTFRASATPRVPTQYRHWESWWIRVTRAAGTCTSAAALNWINWWTFVCECGFFVE